MKLSDLTIWQPKRDQKKKEHPHIASRVEAPAAEGETGIPLVPGVVCRRLPQPWQHFPPVRHMRLVEPGCAMRIYFRTLQYKTCIVIRSH